MRLQNRVCLVTGSSRGIGRAIALTFAGEGANLIVNYRENRNRAYQVVNEITNIGRRAVAMQADVSSKHKVNEMVESAIREFGRIDILVNNAGRGFESPTVLEATEDDLQRTLALNFLGAYYCVQAVAPYMIKQNYGKIVNISSNAALGTTGRSSGRAVAYAPAKAAVLILTKRLAYELGRHNINVNAVAPGSTMTEGFAGTKSEGQLKELVEEKARTRALRRIGRPQDIANVALFLASEESSYVTGQVIVVDGGGFDYLSHGI